MKCNEMHKFHQAGKWVFATGLGKEHFIEMIMEALLREKCGLQKWNLGTFQFIGLWFYKCTPRSTL